MKGIYKISSPSGKVYIGKSTNIEKRFASYKRLLEHSTGRRLLRSLKKYGPFNHTFTILHELPEDVSPSILSEYEIFYIFQHKEAGLQLLNLTNGGEGSDGYKHTPDALIKMSLKSKGRFAGEKNPNYGKGCFGEKNGAFGKNRKSLCVKAAQANEKVVYQYDLGGNLLNQFNSGASAARALGLKLSNLSACCLRRKGYNTAGGFIWRYNKLVSE